MKCVTCQYGKTEKRILTVMLTREETNFLVCDVPAEVCPICGEEYVNAETGKRLVQVAENAVSDGVQVGVRQYQAA